MRGVTTGIGRWATAILALSMAVVGCGKKAGKGPNAPPVIDSVETETNPVDPGTSTTVRVIAKDPDGGGGGPSDDDFESGLSATWSVSGDGWSVEGRGNGEAKVTAPAVYENRATVTVEVSDKQGASTTGKIDLRTGANELPRVVKLTASPNPVEPGGTVALKAEAADPRGDELSYEWSAPEDWSLSSSTGAEVELTAPDRPGASAIVEVSVRDGHQGSIRRTVSVRTERNERPQIAAVSASPPQVEPGGTIDVRVDASDPDGDDLSYTWSAPGGWKIDGSGDQVTVRAPGDHGKHAEITVEVSDERGASATGRVTVGTSFNQGPVIHSLSASPRQVARGGTSTVEVSASDPNGDSLSYSWSVTDNTWSVTGNGPKATVQAPSAPGAATRVEVDVTDGEGKTAKASIYLSTARNRAPTVSDVSASPAVLGPGKTSTLEVTASDPDGDALGYAWTSPSGWTIRGSGKKVDLVAPSKRGRRAAVRVEVTDGYGGKSVGTVVVSTSGNRAPSIASVTASPSIVDKNGRSMLRVDASDPDGDPLGYNWKVPKGWKKVGGSGNAIEVEGPAAFGRQGRFVVVVTDGQGGKTTGAVVVQTKRNRPPTISGMSVGQKVVKPGATTDVTVRAVDPDGDPLSYKWMLPKGWSGSSSSATITITAPKKFGVSGTVKVVVGDGNSSVSDSVTVATLDNNPPVVGQLSVSPDPVLQNGTARASAQASDPNGDPVSYSWSVKGQGWSTAGSGQSVDVRAPNRANATGTVTVVVTDGKGGKDSRSTTVKTKSCPKNKGNCDGKIGNGCEVNLNADSNHCSQCGNACGNKKVCVRGSCKKTRAVLVFDFESGSGTVVNKGKAGNALKGDLKGSVSFENTGKLGSHSLQSPGGSGANDYLDVKGQITKLDMNNAYTAMAWIKVRSGNDQGLIVFGSCCNPRQGYTLNLHSGELRFWGGSDTDDSNYNLYSSNLPTNQWVHVGVRADQSRVEILVDGNQVDSRGTNVPTSPSKAPSQGNHGPNNPHVGGQGISSARGADVLIDEVRVYDEHLGNTKYKKAMKGKY